MVTICNANEYSNIQFKQIDMMCGLPNNTVNTITEDKYGFIWIGTKGGLCKYDGYSVKSYFYDKQDSTSIGHNQITKNYIDRNDGSLWVATPNSVSLYNRANDNFKTYRLPNRGNPLFRAFANDHNGELLIGCKLGVFYINKKEQKLEQYINRTINVVDMTQDNRGNLWLATDKGVLCYDLSRGIFIPIDGPYNKYIDIIQSSWIQSIFCDNNNQIWVKVIGGSVFVIKPGEDIFLTNVPKSPPVYSFSSDKNNNVWMATSAGIRIFDTELNLLSHIQSDDNNLSKLSDSSICSIFCDSQENMWVGTYFGGVNICANNAQGIKVYPKDKGSFLNGKVVRKITKSDNPNEILIATEDGGVNRLNKLTDKITTEYIQNNNVHSLLIEEDGTEWYGTLANGLISYDQHSGIETKVETPNNQNYSVFDIIKDHTGRIWCATARGLLYCDSSKDKLIRDVKLNKLNRIFSFVLLEDKSYNIWVATRNDGLYLILHDRVTIKKIENEMSFVSALYEDTKGRIWVGSDMGSIIVYDHNGVETKRIEDPLFISNSIKSFIEDDKGRMWVGTNRGLIEINTLGGIARYTVADGLPINQFNYNSSYKADSGEIFMGTINGLVRFIPDEISTNRDTFNIQLTELYVNNNIQHQRLNELIETKKIELKYNEAHSIRLSYSGLNFHYGNTTQYSMLLGEVDKEWKNLGTQSNIYISSLAPGNYTLRLRASGDGVTWSDSSNVQYKIIVHKPWWATNIMYLLYSLVIFCTVYVIYYYNTQNFKIKVEYEAEHQQRLRIEELDIQKRNFFTYISHDLKTPLTLILSPIERIINDRNTIAANKDRLRVILRNAQRLLRLIEDLKSFSQIEMKQDKICVKKGNILCFVYELSHIFNVLAQEREIDFVTDIQIKPDCKDWFSPSKLERILYNLLSNAFKYTPDFGRIVLSAEITEDCDHQRFCQIKVSDTGRGFSPKYAEKIFDNYFQINATDKNIGSGIGLALTKSLVAQHKGTISATSEVGVGSCFTITLNISANSYQEDERSNLGIEQDIIDRHNNYMRESVELIDMNNSAIKSTDKSVVLIVEDNIDMNNYICDTMQEHYDVLCAYNGEQGIEIAIKENPSLIITDSMMPYVDGLQLTKTLKNNIETSHIPIVMVTAKSESADITEGYQYGVDAYITKPFATKDLELLVANLLRTKEMQRLCFNKNDTYDLAQITSNPRDEKFMSDFISLIMNNISESELNISYIISQLYVSRSSLHNKVKSLTNLSTTEFIRSVRLKEAKKLMAQGSNVTEAANAVGIYDSNYFARCFKKQFGITPTSFIKNRHD